MIELYKGKKVHYDPGYGEPENGKVKSLCDDSTSHVFVVFNCAGEWDNFENYTAQRTPISDLKSGWTDKAKTKFT